MSLKLLVCPLSPSHPTPTPLSHSPCHRCLPLAQAGQEFQILDFPEKTPKGYRVSFSKFRTNLQKERKRQIRPKIFPSPWTTRELRIYSLPDFLSRSFGFLHVEFSTLDSWMDDLGRNSISLRVSLVATKRINPFIPKGRANSSPSPLFLPGFLCLLVVQPVRDLPGNKRHA